MTEYSGKHDYQISTSGSVSRTLGNGSKKILKPWLSGGRTMREYLSVWLYGLDKTKQNPMGRRKAFVHRLVASAFLTKPTIAHSQVDHINGSKANNTLKNLRWTTPKTNTTYGKRKKIRNINGKANRVDSRPSTNGKGLVDRQNKNKA